MVSVAVPARWKRKPHRSALLDPSHWACANLRYAFHFANAGGTVIDNPAFPMTAIGGSTVARTATLAAGATWNRGAIDFAGGSTSYVTLGEQLDLTVAFTVCTRIRADNVSGLKTIFGNNDTGGNERVSGSLYLDGANLSYWHTATSETLDGTATLTANTWYDIALVRSGSAGSWPCSSYINSVLDDSATSTSNPNTTNTPEFRIGFAGEFTGAPWDGVIDYFYLWMGAKPEGFIKQFHREPYGLWMPPRPMPRYFIPAAAGGDVTVTADLLTATGSLQAPAVTGGAATTSDLLTATAALQAPAVAGGATTTSDLLSATSTVIGPTVTAGSTTTADLLSATASPQAPAVTGESAVTADVLAATAAVQDPAVTTGSALTADLLAAVASILDPTVNTTGGVTVDADVLAGLLSLPDPAVEAGATFDADLLTVSAAFADPTVSGGMSLTADALAAVASLQQPSVSGGGAGGAVPGGSLKIRVAGGRVIRIRTT